MEVMTQGDFLPSSPAHYIYDLCHDPVVLNLFPHLSDDHRFFRVLFWKFRELRCVKVLCKLSSLYSYYILVGDYSCSCVWQR